MQQQTTTQNQSAKQPYTGSLFDDLFDDLDLIDEIDGRQQPRKQAERKRSEPQKPKERPPSKKDFILHLYRNGVTDIIELSQQARTRPSYVANVLQNAGLLKGYNDLYTTTANDQNIYSRFFRNVLSFKSPAAARESVARIDGLYRYFERIADRAGQHHAQILALTGRNRARWSGKHEEARIFAEWLLKN